MEYTACQFKGLIMNIQKKTSFSFIIFFICLLFSLTASAATSSGPSNGEGHTQVHEKYFTKHNYVPGAGSCVECHQKEASDVLTTGHWKWQGAAKNVVGVENEVHGKTDFINNFCIAVPSNEGRCAQCHIGYGYTDKNYDFTNADNIDCLVCHDQTGTYKKAATTAGLPELTIDLDAVARSVANNGGVPGRDNCIFCHANAGGGDNVKHGDLSMSLADTKRKYDVHMGTNGANMACVDCHDVDRNPGGKQISHGIGGMPFHSVDEGQMKQCVDCHTKPNRIHTNPKVQQIVKSHERLSCQVCHIPAIARETSTKVEWYWSDAGKDIIPVPIDPVTGRATYDKKKGSFVWAYNVRPTLRFHNGKWNKTMINVNDIAGDEPIDLGSPAADRTDPDAMIYPFKKMIGNQLIDNYDDYNTILVPHLFGLAGGSSPYWGVYDWVGALLDGTTYTGQDEYYSGTFRFANTEMLLSVNHEIAPKAKALGMAGKCNDCHAEGLIDWPALGWNEDPYKGKQAGGKH